MKKVTVTICMGSSCFARGNRSLVDALKDEVSAKGWDAQVEIRGSLCQSRCSEGPIIKVERDSLAVHCDQNLQDVLRKIEERLK